MVLAGDLRADYKADLADFQVGLEVAKRHGILSERSTTAPMRGDHISNMMGAAIHTGITSPINVEVATTYELTQFGIAFIRACKTPTSS